MTLARGRVLHADEEGALDSARPMVLRQAGANRVAIGRVAKRSVVDAAAEAARLLSSAETRARAIVSDAEQRAESMRKHAAETGKNEAEALLAAGFLRLRAEQAAGDEGSLDRSVALARVMAERLLGETLALDPAKVTAIARQALAQARRARVVAMRAHPDDVEILRSAIDTLGLEGASVQIHADPERARGSLAIRTDLGSLDADLSPQLDRLTAALRETLRSP